MLLYNSALRLEQRISKIKKKNEQNIVELIIPELFN